MSDSQEENSAQIDQTLWTDQHAQDSEYCVNCETWEAASFNSFTENWTHLEAVETEVIVIEAVRTEVEPEVHCSMEDWDQKCKTVSDEKKIKISEDLLITTMNREEQITKNLLDYDIDTTIQNSDKQYDASKEEPTIASQTTDTSKQGPPIASQTTDTSKEKPPIASENTDTSKQGPSIASQTTDTSKVQPPIASQTTDTSKEEPPIASETTDTFKFETSIDSKINGASETINTFKQKPNIDNIDTYQQEPTIHSKIESFGVLCSEFTGTANEPSIDNTIFQDELHESFVKMDAIQPSCYDTEYSIESDNDADNETIIAHQQENQPQNQGTFMTPDAILYLLDIAAFFIIGIVASFYYIMFSS